MTGNKKLGLTARIVIGMAAGILVGFFFKWLLAGQDERILHILGMELPLKTFFIDGIFHIGGEIFIASLKMLLLKNLKLNVFSLSLKLKIKRTANKIRRT